MKRLFKTYNGEALLPLVFLTALLTGCGAAVLSAPSDLKASAADADNPNRIEISWLPVDGAGIYYVYRDKAEDGNFSEYAGFSVTASKDSGGVMRYYFIDIIADGKGGTYWYRVTASPSVSIKSESAKSAAVSATTCSGSWSAASSSVLAEAVLQFSVTASGSELYAVTGGADMSLRGLHYKNDPASTASPPAKKWFSLTGAAGSLNTAGVNAAESFSAVIIGGELGIVYTDSGATPSGALSLKYYHNSGTADEPSFAWTAAGGRGFNSAAAIDINSAVPAGSDIFSAFLETSTLKLYKYKNAGSAWFELSSSEVLNVIGSISTVSQGGTLYLGYEGVGGLYLRSFDSDSDSLQSGGLVYGAAVDGGNAVFISGGGSLYSAYISDPAGNDDDTSGSLSVVKFSDGSWSALDDVAGDLPPEADGRSPYGTLAAAWHNGYLYLFYADSGDSRRGWVKYYDAGLGWQTAQIGGSALTGDGALGSFSLLSSGGVLYASYVEDGRCYLRSLK